MKRFRKVNVFIISGGKCGGATLNNTFNKMWAFKAAHGHSNLYWNGQAAGDPNTVSAYDVLQQNKSLHEKLRVIDSYRDPIERKLAGFFETIETYLPNYKKYSVPELVDLCNTEWLREYETTREWYHPLNDMMKKFGMPRLDSFDFDKKFEVRRHENIEFVKIRFNDISQWGDVLSAAFGRKIKMVNANLSAGRRYEDVYTSFKTIYKVPKWYLDIVRNDAEFKTFKSEEEQAAYLDKWGQRETDEYEPLVPLIGPSPAMNPPPPPPPHHPSS